MSGFLTNAAARLHRMQPLPAEAPRRTTHGSCAWTLPFANNSMRQPQDGALTVSAQPVSSARLRSLRSRATAGTDDDRLSGATRSLASRILGLNGFASRRPALELEPDRYFAEPVRMPKLEAVRKTPEIIRRLQSQVA
jgi:hypothetical protein